MKGKKFERIQEFRTLVLSSASDCKAGSDLNHQGAEGAGGEINKNRNNIYAQRGRNDVDQSMGGGEGEIHNEKKTKL